MKSPIKILANSKTGQVVTMREITNSKTGEVSSLGSVMVEQTHISLDGIARLERRTAFLSLPEDVIDAMSDYLTDGAILPIEGKIVVEETLVPYKSKSGKLQEPKINPTTKAVITYKGQPVYRNTRFTQDMNAQDIFLRDTPTSEDSSSEDATE